VRELALLARLRLSDDEVARMAGDLDAILDYVDALRDLDTSKVEPMTHAVPFDCPLRTDEVRPSLPLEEALANAPRREASFFQVPRIVPGPAGSGGGEDDGP
jgi:aspartyl-tRNA(Asn)/glutamyl-tRNA(Gln) amidotransferase subunit C